jgi:hypothetical protein
MNRFLRDEDGQALVLTLICVGALIGFMALAIDVGLLFRAKRNMQIAADAAATAAAMDYLYNYSSTTAISAAKTVGSSAAAVNGFSSANGATVTINAGANSEISTPWHNSTGYFEAIVSQPSPTAFMGFFGIHAMNIVARSVAGSGGIVNQGCVYVLNPTNACPAMTLQGSFTVTATQCGVVVNGTCDSALQFTGGGGTLSAASVTVQGGANGQTGDSTPAPVTGVAPVTNPMEAVVPPDPSQLICTAPSGGTLTGNVGTDGVTTCYSGNVTLNNVSLAGTVVFTGNVTLSGNINTLDNNGITIVLSSGGLQESTGTTMNIHAPPGGSGPYAEIALLAPTTNTSTIEFDKGAAGGTFSGIIDAPDATLYLHDSGGDSSGGLTINADIAVGILNDQTATFTVNSYSESHPFGSPLLHVALVE